MNGYSATLSSPALRKAIVVMIDSDRMTIELLPPALSNDPLIQVVGKSTDLEQGLQLVSQLAPNILLIDGRTFRTGFRQLMSSLPVRLKQLQVGVFVDQLSDTELDRCLTMSVGGLFSKAGSVNELVEGLRRMTRNELAISGQVSSRLHYDDRLKQYRVASRERIGKLTDLQLEVLVQLANGVRVREIAAKLHLSTKAVESHKYRIMQQLDVHDRLDLCRWAIREGLVEA